jgi:hypothetical protein
MSKKSKKNTKAKAIVNTKGAAKAEPKEKKVKELDKDRIKRFAGVAELNDSMYKVLVGIKAKEDLAAMSQLELTAAILTFIKPDQIVEWKSLVNLHNAKRKEGVAEASLFSDGRNNAEAKCFNMRNILWNAEHKAKYPIRVISGDKYMNKKVHAQDGRLRGKLMGFTLLPSTHAMLKKEAKLANEVQSKLYK